LNFIQYDVQDGLALSQISGIATFSDGRLIISTFGAGINIYDGQNFELINTTNGLANNTVYGLAKQKDNIIWAATEKGLSKIKGNKVTNFYKENGLPSELIWSIALAKEIVWIGTNYGLAKLENGIITVIENDLVAKKEIWSLYSDVNGNLWIATIEDVIFYDHQNHTFHIKEEFKNISTVQSFSEDREGSIWAGSENGLYKITGDKIEPFTSANDLTSNFIWSIFIDSKNRMWLGTEKGVTLYENGNFIQLTAKEGLSDYKTWKITEDLEGNIWVGTDAGLFKIVDMSFKIYKKVNGKPIDAWTIVERSKSNYFIGTELHGILSFDNGIFKEVNVGDADFTGLSTIFIDNNNRTWVATEKGIYCYSNFDFTRSIIKFTDISGPVPQIIQNHKGELIFSTYYDGSIKYTENEFRVKKEKESEVPLIFYHFIDSQNNLWAATSFGLQLVIEDSMFIPKGFEQLADYSFLNIIEDPYGYIWSGSYEDGLFIFNPKELENPVFDTVSVKHGLNNASVMAMVIDADSNLWVSTNGGLNRVDINSYHRLGKKKVLAYNSYDGIPGGEGFQNGMLRDSDNNILFSTINGLVVFNPRDIVRNEKEPFVRIKRIKMLDRNFSEIIIDENDLVNFTETALELPYGHNNLTIEFVGISLANPSKIKYSYQLNDKNWSVPSYVPIAYLPNLPYGEYTFRVKASNNNGVWNEVPAVLKFELIAPFWERLWFQILVVLAVLGIILLFFLYRINKMNKANQELEERINERIRYENQLLKSEKELRAAKEEAERLNKLKTEFLAQMSHEIRTPINSILSYTSLLKEDINDKIDESLKDGFSIIQSSSRRLINTIDSILNLSQIQTGNLELNKKPTDLCEIIKNIYREFRSLAYQKKLEMNLNIDVKNCNVKIDQYTVTQMIANLLDNAVKYTNRGRINISLYNAGNDKFKLEICDTGIGMSDEFKQNIFKPFTQEYHGYSREYKGSGLGLALVMKYAKINDLKLSFSSKKGEGTTFTILFYQ
jgi:signal transduction histidine kinase/ligand-binding sensor domain-containing protein